MPVDFNLFVEQCKKADWFVTYLTVELDSGDTGVRFYYGSNRVDYYDPMTGQLGGRYVGKWHELQKRGETPPIDGLDSPVGLMLVGVDLFGHEITRRVDQMMAPGVTVDWTYDPEDDERGTGGLIWVQYNKMGISTGWRVEPYMVATKDLDGLAKVAARDICNTLAHRAGRYFMRGVPND